MADEEVHVASLLPIIIVVIQAFLLDLESILYRHWYVTISMFKYWEYFLCLNQLIAKDLPEYIATLKEIDEQVNQKL